MFPLNSAPLGLYVAATCVVEAHVDPAPILARSLPLVEKLDRDVSQIRLLDGVFLSYVSSVDGPPIHLREARKLTRDMERWGVLTDQRPAWLTREHNGADHSLYLVMNDAVVVFLRYSWDDPSVLVGVGSARRLWWPKSRLDPARSGDGDSELQPPKPIKAKQRRQEARKRRRELRRRLAAVTLAELDALEL